VSSVDEEVADGLGLIVHEDIPDATDISVFRLDAVAEGRGRVLEVQICALASASQNRGLDPGAELTSTHTGNVATRVRCDLRFAERDVKGGQCLWSTPPSDHAPQPPMIHSVEFARLL